MRGLALAVNSNVPLVRLELQPPQGDGRAFAVQGGSLLIPLRDGEKDGPLGVKAITAGGLEIKETLPTDTAVWNVKVSGPGATPATEPIPWKPVAVGAGLMVAVALLWKWYTSKDAPPPAPAFDDALRANGYRMLGQGDGIQVWGRDRT